MELERERDGSGGNERKQFHRQRLASSAGVSNDGIAHSYPFVDKNIREYRSTSFACAAGARSPHHPGPALPRSMSSADAAAKGSKRIGALDLGAIPPAQRRTVNEFYRQGNTSSAPHDAPFAGCGVLMRQKTIRESSMVDLAPDARPHSPSPGQVTGHGMIFIPGGTFRMGSDKPLSRRSPGASRYRRRLLDRPHAGHQSRVPQVRQRDRPHHLRGDQAEGRGLSRRAAAHAESRLARLHAAEACGRYARLVAVVEFQVRRRLAQALWAALLDQRARRSSGRAYRLSRRRGLRGSGPARSSRPKPSGSSRRAAGLRTPSSPGAISSRPTESMWRTPGKGRSRTKIFRPTATRAPRR